MNLPIPPTDNLYKFLAITGLIIVGVGIFSFYSYFYDSQLRFIRLEADAADLDAKATNDVRERTRNEALGKTMIAECKLMFEKVKTLGNVCICGTIIGTIIAFTGFALWYSRVQVYQDAILKNEAARRKSQSK